MRVVHVLRKPCSESTVAANVLRWGTGGVNVDASRVGTSDRLGGGATSRTSADQKGNEGWTRPWMSDPVAQEAHAERVRVNVAKAEALGRWPANLILGHLPACVQAGTRKIKGVGPGSGGGFKDGKFSGQVGQGNYTGTTFKGFADADGMETVTAWTCEPGCPAAALDAQSGVLPARGNVNPSTQGGGAGFSGGTRPIASEHHTRPELRVAGGASRFFKHFGGKGEP